MTEGTLWTGIDRKVTAVGDQAAVHSERRLTAAGDRTIWWEGEISGQWGGNLPAPGVDLGKAERTRQ